MYKRVFVMKNVSLLLVCLLIGCVICKLAAAIEDQKAQPTTPIPGQNTADSVAVTVNGIDITEGQLDEEIKPQLQKLTTQASQMPPAFLEKYKTQIRQEALKRMVVGKLLDEKAKQINIQITDEQVLGKIEEMAGQQQPSLSLEDFKALIEARGQSFEQVKERIRKGLGYQKIVEAQFEGKINVTEEDIKKFYAENKKRFETPEQVKASHILIKTEPKDSNDVKAEAKQKAELLLKQIRNGADFAELAKATGGYPSAPKGGDLGFFGRGQMVPSFDKTAFKLEVGQVSDVVETKFGYHIIKVADRKEPSVTVLGDAKNDIIAQVQTRKKSELAAQYIESLKAQANIVYPPGKEPKTPNVVPQAITPNSRN